MIFNFYYFTEKCYKIEGGYVKNTISLSWDKASDKCKSYGGNLVSIHSRKEQDFIDFLLLQEKYHTWNGLNDRENESQYIWADGSQLDFSYWTTGEPSGHGNEVEDCTEMWYGLRSKSDFFGTWNDVSCDELRAYICQKKKSETEKSPNPLYCSSDEGGGWKYEESCYHVIKELKSWDDAEQHCKKIFNGHLTTILDKPVEYFLDYMLSDTHDEFWIGIKIQGEFLQKWTSGWHVSYHNINEISTNATEEMCVLRKARKEWTTAPCSGKHTFICEKTKVTPPILNSTVNGPCPEVSIDWKDLGGDFCYYFAFDKQATWYEANFECERRGSELLSLHSKEESEILIPFVQYTESQLHIGLFRNPSDKGDFVWSDGSEMNYKNWHWNEPTNQDDKCSFVWTRFMTWGVIGCEDKLGYICSIRKNSSDTSKVAERFKCSGLVSSKILIGICISIFLLIITVGIVVYYCRPSNENRVKNGHIFLRLFN